MQEAEITFRDSGKKDWVSPVTKVVEDETHFHITNDCYTYSYEKVQATYVIQDIESDTE